MKKKIFKLLSILSIFLLVFLVGCENTSPYTEDNSSTYQGQKESYQNQEDSSIEEDKYYYSLEDVAAYIHTYNKLPDNYITKEEADQMDWTTGDKTYVVGGNKFRNREGLLPEKQGRQYYEADIQAGYTDHRGPERIVFSNDGLIFYTDDHYDSFQQLY